MIKQIGVDVSSGHNIGQGLSVLNVIKLEVVVRGYLDADCSVLILPQCS